MKQQEIQVSIISFTEKGSCLARKIKNIFETCLESKQWLAQEQCDGVLHVRVQESRKISGSLKEWIGGVFLQSKALIFVGAVGIAVRLIADFVTDKFLDPAVLVVDELGNFVIPILSGHVGGGNACAAFLAQKLKAVPVITTATDLYGKFAVDVFAAKNKLSISDRRMAKEISAAVLRGERIGFCSEKQVFGSLPEELVWENEVSENSIKKPNRYKVHVGVHSWEEDSQTLFLHPKALALGIGCKKGKSMEEIEQFVLRKFRQEQLARDSVFCVASVDLKKWEKGLLDFCRKWRLPFRTFSIEQLSEIPGTFTESEFVADTVGVGNVCERAAMRCAMELIAETKGEASELRQRLIQKKAAEDGITLAVAEIDWSVEFE